MKRQTEKEWLEELCKLLIATDAIRLRKIVKERDRLRKQRSCEGGNVIRR